MPILSGGALVLADSSPITARTTYYTNTGLDLTGVFATYGAIYRRQLWVYVVVRKRAKATARLPLKVYQRKQNASREDARDTPYGRLIQRPNPRLDPFFFWEWTSSTADVYGEFMWFKMRDANGVPESLWPIHPTNVTIEKDENGKLSYIYTPGLGSEPRLVLPERDVVHYRSYNPDSTTRGLSPCEPLRMTLLNEDAARRATQSYWKNGARPGVALEHPKKLSTMAAERLRADWDALHAGTDSTGNTAVLEEGMTARFIPLNLEEAQYIETRKLNREEVCAAYDVPPPVVHILDRATFSNITEQMRSMYRDTMAPHLGAFEAVLEQQLRPEFGDDIYAEFLMDEVLRGSFEARQDAYAKADYMTVAEKRRNENLPFIEGTDRILVNGAYVPLDAIDSGDVGAANALARVRDIVFGRLGSCASLDEVDPEVITAGLNGEGAIVREALMSARAANDSIAEFRSRLSAALS